MRIKGKIDRLADTDHGLSFNLRWIFLAVAAFSIVFATIATNGSAAVIVYIVIVCTPFIALGYFALVSLCDGLFGPKKVPLASTRRNPLGIDDRERGGNVCSDSPSGHDSWKSSH